MSSRAPGPYATTPNAPTQPIMVAISASRIARPKVAAGTVAITPSVAARTPVPTAQPAISGSQSVTNAAVAVAAVSAAAQNGRPPVRTASPRASAVDRVPPLTSRTRSGTSEETRTRTMPATAASTTRIQKPWSVCTIVERVGVSRRVGATRSRSRVAPWGRAEAGAGSGAGAGAVAAAGAASAGGGPSTGGLGRDGGVLGSDPGSARRRGGRAAGRSAGGRYGRVAGGRSARRAGGLLGVGAAGAVGSGTARRRPGVRSGPDTCPTFSVKRPRTRRRRCPLGDVGG